LVPPFGRQLVSISAISFFDFADGDASVCKQYFSHGYRLDKFQCDLGPVSDGVFAEGVVAFDGDDPKGDACVGADDAAVMVEGAVGVR
jgi:hypothetical protein